MASGGGCLRHPGAVDAAADYDEVVAHGPGPGMEGEVLTAMLGMGGDAGIIGNPRERRTAPAVDSGRWQPRH